MNGIADYIAKELETETFQKQLTTAAVERGHDLPNQAGSVGRCH